MRVRPTKVQAFAILGVLILLTLWWLMFMGMMVGKHG